LTEFIIFICNFGHTHLYSGGYHSTKQSLKLILSAGQVQTKYILQLSYFVESSNISQKCH